MPNSATIAPAGRACLAGLALAIMSVSLATAELGPQTSIGATYQQTSTTMSANGITEGSCNGSVLCYVLFQRAPEQKALIVQHVSCRVVVSAGGLGYGVLTARKGQNVLLREASLTPVNTTGTAWVVTNPVIHLVQPKEYPLVFFTNSVASPNWVVKCNISGALKQP